MKTLKKATALFLSLTVAAGVLAGCGSTTDQEADTATPETSTTTPAQDTQTAESNVDKALALINTFATGDTDTARSLLSDGYIQHNLAYGTGAGEQVAFDIFRFDENGKIAEHWDVMETIADQSTWQNQNGKF